MPRLSTRVPAALLATTLALGIAGCSSAPQTRVIVDSGKAEESTSAITPLERGTIRREALDAVRSAIEAWMASDTKGMEKYFSKSIMDSFEKNWSVWDARGLSVKHEHEEVFLDMIDMTKDGTQALVTYRYNDTSYLVDSSGAKAETLPAFKEKEIQFTLEFSDGEWKIIRAIGGADAYR